MSGGVNTQFWSVTYDGYSDDGQSVLDGYEQVDSPFTIAYGRWQADLRLSGAHTGTLKGDVTVRTGGQGSGSVTSELDGRRFEGLPKPECDRLPTPALRGTRCGGVPAGGRRGCGSGSPPACPAMPWRRPVRAATVALGRKRKRTRANGRARLVAKGRLRARAGCTSAPPASRR